MPTTLICRFPQADFSILEYQLVDSNIKQFSFWTWSSVSITQLTELSTQSFKDIILLIPTTAILLTETTLMTRNYQQLIQAVPYALEDFLAEEVDNLHFSLGTPNKTQQTIPVAIIQKQILNNYLQAIAAFNLKVNILLPDVLIIPYYPNAWTICLFNHTALVRTGQQTGFCLEINQLELALSLTLTEQNTQPQNIKIFRESTYSNHLTFLEKLGIPLEEIIYKQGEKICLSENLSIPPLNLLQGEYRSQEKMAISWRKWVITGGLLLILSMSFFIQEWVNVRKLAEERRFLDKQMEIVYKQTFPDAQRIVNPRVQMEQSLKTLRQTSTQTQKVDFLILLNKTSRYFSQIENLQLKRLDFRQGNLEFTLILPNLQSVEKLKQDLLNEKLQVEILSANSSNTGVDTRLRIETKDK